MSAQRPRDGIAEVPARSMVCQVASCWQLLLSYSSSEPGSDWQHVEEPEAFNNTISLATGAGATAEIEFEGIGIEVYGSIAQSGIGQAPTSSYALDEGDIAVYTASQSDTNQTKVLFYTSNTLPAGKHILVIKNEVADGQLSLDYFLLSPTPKKGVGPGAIVGAVLGPLTLILITILAVFYFRKRREVQTTPNIGRRVRQSSPDAAEKRLPTNATWSVITPFDLQGTPQSDSVDTLQAGQPLLRHQTEESAASSSGLNASQDPSRSSSPLAPPPLPPRTSGTSGSRPLPVPPESIELNRLPPPQYSGSGLDPVRKSALPPSYTPPSTSNPPSRSRTPPSNA